MIISMEAIQWFLTGKKLDDKTIIALAKFQGTSGAESESLRKNLSNLFSSRHVATETTLKKIKLFFEKLAGTDEKLIAEINNTDLLAEIDLSTPELSLKYLESMYCTFFQSAGLEGSFIEHEVKIIFKALLNACLLKHDGASNIVVERELLSNDLLSKLNLNNDLLIDIRVKGVIYGQFSLNILLYLFACFELLDGEVEDSIMQKIIKELLIDLDQGNKLKTAFDYYVFFWKMDSQKYGKKLTSKEVAKKIGIDELEMSEFYAYKSGRRAVPKKCIKSILENGGGIFYSIVFLKRLIETFTNDTECKLLIVSSLKEYPKYVDIAQSRSKKSIVVQGN